MIVEYFSKGKNNKLNEDYFDYNDKNFVIADGATDKNGKKYSNKTSGEIISRLVVKEALKSSLNGVKLINLINKKTYFLYKQLNILNKTVDPKFRFSCCVVVARIVKENLIVTQLGDSGFRINCKDIFLNIKQIDINNAKKRAEYIRKTGNIIGSRDYIVPTLLNQFKYQNNPNHRLGYGVIDGIYTPSKFIKVFKFFMNKVNTVELFTDGYLSVPNKTTINDWEKIHKKIEKEDPYKYKKYLSVKSKDDRTVAIIKF